MQSMKKLALAVALCSAATAYAADIKVGIALDISGPFLNRPGNSGGSLI